MLNIEATSNTPFILFDDENGILTIEGISYAVNALDFYKQLLAIINEYVNQPCIITVISIKLEYLNTSSSKSLVEILQRFEAINKPNEVSINWYYEKDDDDILEIGKDFQTILKVPFNLLVQ